MTAKIKVNKWDKFWMFKVIEEIKKNKCIYFICECQCWGIKEVRTDHLRTGGIVSCWCFAKEQRKKSITTHWMTWTRFYRIYNNMKNRCEYKKYHEFKYYWWRWIKCKWNSFEEFRDDMYASYLCHSLEYWENQTTIDRINVNWNYCIENCRWATYKLQANNKRDVKNTK